MPPPPPPGPRKWYWTTQPFKSLYIAIRVMSILLRMPFWLLTAALGFKPRQSWSVKRTVILKALRNFNLVAARCDLRMNRNLKEEPKASSLKASKLIWAPPVGKDKLVGFVKRTAEINGVVAQRTPCFWFKRRQDLHKPFARAQANDTVALYVHGGGYTIGTAHEMDLTANIAKGLLSKTNIGAVLSVDYRLAHDDPFPTALIDALCGYAYLIEECGYSPSKIIVGGDSAGGNLTHALVRYLRDEKVYPLPAGQLLLSPWCDMALTQRQSGQANFESDFLDREMGPRGVLRFFRNLPDDVRHSPYCSPADPSIPRHEWDSVFADFPSTLITAGGAEILYDEIVETTKRYEAAGHRVTWVEERDAPHDWLIFPWCEPERSSTFKQISAWIDEVVA